MLNIKIIMSIILLLILPLTIYLVYHNTDSRQFASEEAVLYMVSDQPVAEKGQLLTYTLSIDTHTTPVRSVHLSLSYPANKAEIQKITTSQSPFDLPIEEITGNGYVQFGREASTPVYGDQQVATIQVLAKEPFLATEISPVTGTKILSLENQNIYTNALSREKASSTEQSRNPFTSFLKAITALFKK